MGNTMSAVWVGVVAKVFKHKTGKTLLNYCSTCDKTGVLSEHCPKCGGKIEKTFQEKFIVLEPHIFKHLSKKQIKVLSKYQDVQEAMFDGKLFEGLDCNEEPCNDPKDETVLVGECVSSLGEDGLEDCTLTFKKFVKVFNKLKKLGLVKKLDDVRYYHTQTYC